MKIIYNLIISTCLITSSIFAQESSNSSGGDATGNGGQVSYSIGQVAYTNHIGSNGNINQGVQQPIEIFSIGVEKVDADINLSVYPNPSTSLLQLSFKEFFKFDASFQLMDISGKILSSSKVLKENTEISILEYPSGIYLLQLFTKNKNLKSFKIVKK